MTPREKVGSVVVYSCTGAIFCNLLEAFGVDGSLFFVVRAVLGTVFVVAAIAWIVMWLVGRRAKTEAPTA